MVILYSTVIDKNNRHGAGGKGRCSPLPARHLGYLEAVGVAGAALHAVERVPGPAANTMTCHRDEDADLTTRAG